MPPRLVHEVEKLQAAIIPPREMSNEERLVWKRSRCFARMVQGQVLNTDLGRRAFVFLQNALLVEFGPAERWCVHFGETNAHGLLAIPPRFQPEFHETMRRFPDPGAGGF